MSNLGEHSVFYVPLWTGALSLPSLSPRLSWNPSLQNSLRVLITVFTLTRHETKHDIMNKEPMRESEKDMTSCMTNDSQMG